MSMWGLIKRSLLFYRRTNAGVFLAVLVSTAVLTGALVVGDSVRYSLLMMVRERLGQTELALELPGRFFRAELADDLSAELDGLVAPVLHIRGFIEKSDDSRAAKRVDVYGVDERFFLIGGTAERGVFRDDGEAGVVVNESLAEQLGVGVGDEVKLRIQRPGLMPREVPLTPDSDLSLFFRVTVEGVAGKEQFGRFGVQANQVWPLNVFVPLDRLQADIGRPGRANMLLIGGGQAGKITVEQANAAMRKCWRLSDAEIEFRRLEGRDALEMRSRRVFIDSAIGDAALKADGGGVGILTYFVNELRVGERVTPYSMVTAMSRGAGGVVPVDMGDDEVLINQWLAEDLGAGVGDRLDVTYTVLGPMRKLVDRKSSFRIRGVIGMETAGVDAELMPDFEDLADVSNCRDWKPGITIDLAKIRKKDEAYWDRYRGTPKALVTLGAGQSMWSNRYGNMTAIRYYGGGTSAEDIERAVLDAVDPGWLGLFFQPVLERGLKAGSEASYFGWLFLGLSMFLIVAAVVLTGLLFVFGVESRSEQIGTLLAVGFSAGAVRGLLLGEGAVIAFLGAISGTAGALVYTRVMIWALSAAMSGSTIYFDVEPATVLIGASAAVVISVFAIWLTVRKEVGRPARELLAGVARWQFVSDISVWRGRAELIVAGGATAGALALLGVAGQGSTEAVAGAFFAAGSLLLVAGLAAGSALLKRMAGSWKKPMSTLAGLGLRNCSRRSGRSLAVMALLACGVFLVVAVEVFRRDPLAGAERHDSGTGGFTLFGESAIGILQDLNSEQGRKALGLAGDVMEGVEVVPLRVRDGDDASCFNLNRAQRPRLLGVRPERLSSRGSFRFVSIESEVGLKAGWDILKAHDREGVVPAVGDYPTIKWALGKSLGDQIEYRDEKGRTFKVRLVGMLENSILQGSLVIAEDRFVERFPSEEGYRMLLIETAPEKVEAVAEHLSSRLAHFGLAVTSAKRRLAAFSEVENTYISIFQILGGLGLLLGSIGLGLVVLRNMLERRGELAMLQAVGFNRGVLKRLVLYEHWGLLAGGLVCGIFAAIVSVGPALKLPGTGVSYYSLSLTVGAIVASGVAWVWLATGFSLSGNILDGLRNE